MVTSFGERDGRQMEKLLTKLPVERGENAQWAIAVQWRRRHEFGAANNLAMPFFDRVIQLRYPADLSPVKGPIQLKAIDELTGWVGDVSAWGKRPVEVKPAARGQGIKTTCWFPDRYTARVWQSFVTAKPMLNITLPKSVDKKPFGVVKRNVSVRVRQVGKADLRLVELFDGDKPLALAKQGSVEFSVELSPGIHSLIARGHSAGKIWLSRPCTVIVE